MLIIEFLQYFMFAEKWSFLEAMYFSAISLTSIGLGDVSPSRFHLTVVHFCFIFMGLASVSTIINVMQSNINNMLLKITEEIEKEMKKRVEDPEEPPQSAIEILSGVLGRLNVTHLKNFFPQGQLKMLINNMDRVLNMKQNGTQTDKIYCSLATQTDPMKHENQAQTDPIIIKSYPLHYPTRTAKVQANLRRNSTFCSGGSNFGDTSDVSSSLDDDENLALLNRRVAAAGGSAPSAPRNGDSWFQQRNFPALKSNELFRNRPNDQWNNGRRNDPFERL